MTAPYVTRESLAARSLILARRLAVAGRPRGPRGPRPTCAGADNDNLPDYKRWKKRMPKQIDGTAWLDRGPVGAAWLRALVPVAKRINEARERAAVRDQQRRRRAR